MSSSSSSSSYPSNGPANSARSFRDGGGSLDMGNYNNYGSNGNGNDNNVGGVSIKGDASIVSNAGFVGAAGFGGGTAAGNTNPHAPPSYPEEGSLRYQDYGNEDGGIDEYDNYNGYYDGDEDDDDDDDEHSRYYDQPPPPRRKAEDFFTQPDPECVGRPVHVGPWIADQYREYGLDMLSGGMEGFGAVQGEVQRGGGGTGGGAGGYGGSGGGGGFGGTSYGDGFGGFGNTPADGW
mmetsp:Transcript_32577/g.65491  ORF Transcript_32577/g.65491 Transcript_32577/m.65491 type:complete len:235 (+) Transcript_32577:208-912(+)